MAQEFQQQPTIGVKAPALTTQNSQGYGQTAANSKAQKDTPQAHGQVLQQKPAGPQLAKGFPHLHWSGQQIDAKNALGRNQLPCQ